MRTSFSQTPIAEAQIKALRGKDRDAFYAFLADLARNGCAALGYRLAGDVLATVCCKHLRGRQRVLVGWRTPDEAIVLLVGDHDRSSPDDIYGLLLQAAGLDAPPDDERDKPSCCDGETGLPPEIDPDLVEDLLRRVRNGRWA